MQVHVIDVTTISIVVVIYLTIKIIIALFNSEPNYNKNYGNGEPIIEYEEIHPPKETKLKRARIKRRR